MDPLIGDLGLWSGFLDEQGDAPAVLTRRCERDEALPCRDGAAVVLFDLVEHLALVQERRSVLRVELERLVEGLERGIGVAAHRHDQAEMGHGVDVAAVALEHRLVGRDGLLVAASIEALTRRLEHPGHDLGRDGPVGGGSRAGSARHERAGADRAGPVMVAPAPTTAGSGVLQRLTPTPRVIPNPGAPRPRRPW
jgi:hypothetical protein